MAELRERLAELEHEQWMAWAKAVWDEVSPARRERWAPLMVPYHQLTEASKDQDREWADKVLATVNQQGGG
jgi:RyR domain-containing protein